MRRGSQRFNQVKVGKPVYLLHMKPCNAFNLRNFITKSILVLGDIGNAHRKRLLTRSGLKMHVPNCEMITNYVKDRKIACPIYCMRPESLTSRQAPCQGVAISFGRCRTSGGMGRIKWWVVLWGFLPIMSAARKYHRLPAGPWQALAEKYSAIASSWEPFDERVLIWAGMLNNAQ